MSTAGIARPETHPRQQTRRSRGGLAPSDRPEACTARDPSAFPAGHTLTFRPVLDVSRGVVASSAMFSDEPRSVSEYSTRCDLSDARHPAAKFAEAAHAGVEFPQDQRLPFAADDVHRGVETTAIRLTRHVNAVPYKKIASAPGTRYLPNVGGRKSLRQDRYSPSDRGEKYSVRATGDRCRAEAYGDCRCRRQGVLIRHERPTRLLRVSTSTGARPARHWSSLIGSAETVTALLIGQLRQRIIQAAQLVPGRHLRAKSTSRSNVGVGSASPRAYDPKKCAERRRGETSHGLGRVKRRAAGSAGDGGSRRFARCRW